MKTTPLENNKRVWVKGLVLECPLHKAMDDCPLNALRHLPVAQMNKTVNRLSDKRIENIIDIHKECFGERVQSSKQT